MIDATLMAAILDSLKDPTDNEKHRIYMRAVRGADGQVLGYYERYELPAK
jgi:hypothetical protein